MHCYIRVGKKMVVRNYVESKSSRGVLGVKVNVMDYSHWATIVSSTHLQLSDLPHPLRVSHFCDLGEQRRVCCRELGSHPLCTSSICVSLQSPPNLTFSVVQVSPTTPLTSTAKAAKQIQRRMLERKSMFAPMMCADCEIPFQKDNDKRTNQRHERHTYV